VPSKPAPFGQDLLMPRRVDADQRRAQIIEALWRVTARQGLAAVSFRSVASEAGVSVNLIQHYFGTKADLMHAALVRIGERVVNRGLQRIADAGPEPSPQAVLRAVLTAALPHDEGSRLDMVLFLTFYIAGFTDPTLANAATLTAPMSIMGVFTDLLRDAQQNGQLRPGVDPDVEGAMLLAAVPGLGLSLAAGTTTIDEISVAVDRTLDRLFIQTPRKRPTKP
jgi:AcrR family transcriptional regulator